MTRIYLDHNATTPMRAEVRELLAELAGEPLGNASSVHASGRRARDLVDAARARVATALGVLEEEIVFTSGGTEANNLALLGGAAAAGARSAVVTTAVEHSSVLAPAEVLASQGHRVTLVPVDEVGRVRAAGVIDAAQSTSAALVSVQAANNEVGVVQPVAEIGPALRSRSDRAALFHVDAVQALGKIPVALRAWSCDLASLSAHKVGGPQGIGVLYRRRGVIVAPRSFGGGQELGLRPGTEPAAAIAAASLAIELAVRDQPQYARAVGELARRTWSALAARVPALRLAGPSIDDPARLPNTLNALFAGADGKILVTRLDLDGLELSAGSACASGAIEPSHVLLAMGYSTDEARAGLRLSLGRATSAEECERAVDVLVRNFVDSRASLGRVDRL